VEEWDTAGQNLKLLIASLQAVRFDASRIYIGGGSLLKSFLNLLHMEKNLEPFEPPRFI
jgi:hypothetical protein